MIEPRLTEPAPAAATSAAAPVRLLATQARGHIGRRLLHQQADGEIVEDVVWRWSSGPDRYLDSALRLAFASHKDLRLVDAGSAASMGVTLIAWHLESAGGGKLVGAVELEVTRPDRAVRTEVIRGNEPVSGALPGDLAAASGRLLQTLASESLARVVKIVR
jgi:hypothetical protein